MESLISGFIEDVYGAPEKQTVSQETYYDTTLPYQFLTKYEVLRPEPLNCLINNFSQLGIPDPYPEESRSSSDR